MLFLKARLIKNLDNEYQILCGDGTIAKADLKNISSFFRRFLVEEFSGGEEGVWNTAVPDMLAYQGETFAYITDNNQLVVVNPIAFEPLFEVHHYDFSDLMGVPEYAKAVGKSIEQVKVHLRNGRIPNAAKIGRDWIIAKDSVNKYPQDHRISTGKYAKKTSDSLES